MSLQWTQEDGWVLLALLYHDRNKPDDRADLKDIIAYGDWMSHSVMMHEELSGALRRLLSSRLINYKRPTQTYKVTAKARRLFKVLQSERKGVVNQLLSLRHLLNCPHCGIELTSPLVDHRLSHKTSTEAVTKYRAQWKK